jgi:hypothetical protein
MNRLALSMAPPTIALTITGQSTSATVAGHRASRRKETIKKSRAIQVQKMAYDFTFF